MKAVAVILLVVALGGCANLDLTRPVIPPSLLTCPASPSPPPKPRTQAAVAGWVLDVVEAGADCRAKLDAVRKLEVGETPS